MPTDPIAAFGPLLRNARREAGLTQEALAERAGVSVRTIADLERGVNRAPRRDTLNLLAEALNLLPDEQRRWERLRVRLAVTPARRYSPPSFAPGSSQVGFATSQPVPTHNNQMPKFLDTSEGYAPVSRSPKQVFISYHSADGEFARLVRAHLKTRGVSTWMDQYDAPLGSYLADEIDRGLAASDVIVGILSADAAASRDVMNQWDWGIQNRKPLILLKVRPTVTPHRYIAITTIDATSADPSLACVTLSETLGITPVDPPTPVTRYTRVGDVNIAYQVIGSGPIDIVYCFGFVSNIEVIWEEPRYNRFLRRLASFSRLILFDKRGVGSSDRVSYPPTMEQRMEDVQGVMDAVGLRRAVLAGFSEGAPLAIQFAATYPKRVMALVLYGSYACGIQKPDYPHGRTLQENEQELARIRAHWGDESFVLPFVPGAEDDPQLLRWFARMIRLSATPRDAEAIAIVGNEIDVRHILPNVRVPTLVLHRTGDRACRIGEGRYVAENIPGAQFVELPGSDHSPFFGDQDAIVEAIKAFLAELPSATLSD